MLKPSIVLFFLCILGSTLRAESEIRPIFTDSYWDDGKAEVAVYDAMLPHYGTTYPSNVSLLYVKEPFRTDTRVKSDRGSGENIVPVIKSNMIISTQTGSYHYEQMHSSFWEISSQTLLKWSLSHHEACGATFKMGIPDTDILKMIYHTYWDGAADGELSIPIPENSWHYEELPYRLRMRTASREKDSLHIHLFSPVIHSQLGTPGFRPATIIWKDDLPHSVFEVRHAGGVDVLTFARKFPHVLIKWERADGGSLKLKEMVRTAYWNKHRPTDERLMP